MKTVVVHFAIDAINDTIYRLSYFALPKLTNEFLN